MRLTEEVNALLFEQADAWFSSEEDPEGELRAALANIALLYDEHSVLLRAIVEVSTYDEEVAVFWRSTLGRFIDADRAPHRAGAGRGPLGRRRRAATAFALVLDDRAHALPGARPGAAGRQGRRSSTRWRASGCAASTATPDGALRADVLGPDRVELAGLQLAARRRRRSRAR